MSYKNPFESGQRKVIPAVLIYAKRDDRFLMLFRNAKENDYHQGKWNGVGGKCELDESPLEAAAREFREETEAELPSSAFTALGVVQFPNFKPARSEDWIVFVFLAKMPSSLEIVKRCEEGELHWIESDRLLELNFWPGDRHFLPFVVQEQPFMGTIWYENQAVKRHWIMPFKHSNSKLDAVSSMYEPSVFESKSVEALIPEMKKET